MGVIIKFKSDERKNINNVMLKMFDKPFQYDLHIRFSNRENTGELKVEKRYIFECEDIIDRCNAKITSTVIYD